MHFTMTALTKWQTPRSNKIIWDIDKTCRDPGSARLGPVNIFSSIIGFNIGGRLEVILMHDIQLTTRGRTEKIYMLEIKSRPA